MKRFFFSLIALSAAAIGCTQSAMLESPEIFNQEVSFSPYTGRTPVTKATSIENAAGLANANPNADPKADPNGFYVYGFLKQDGVETPSLYLENEKVYSPSKGATENDWKYDNVIYWPTTDSKSKLNFVAYSANGVNNGLSGISENGFTFTVQKTVANQVDLLATAYQADNTVNSNDGSVILKFHHLLSRVGFKVQSTTSKEVTITELTFTGDMPTQGTLDFDAAIGDNAIPELVPTAVGTPTYDCMTGNSGAAGAIDDEGNTNSVRVPGTEYLMIMPHIVGAEYDNINTDQLKGSDHKVNVTYTIEGSDQPRTAEVTLPIGFEFVAGRAYEIILKISTSSLSFDVEEQDWNNPDGSNNADINPNDPPVPGDDDEEEEPAPIVYTETSITGSNLEFRISEVTNGSATVTLRVLNSQYEDVQYKSSALTTSTADVGELKIVYRQKGSDAWNVAKTMDSSPYGIRYECTFSNLDPEIEYECCVYIKNREITSYKDNWKGGKDPQFTSFDEGYGQKDAQGNRHYLTFITKSPFIYPVLTVDEAAAVTKDANNLFSTEIQASYSLGYLNSNPIKIKEYGICWVKGEDDPTLEDDKERWMVPADAEETSYLFKSSLNHLKPNTTYSYAAYVIIEQDVDIYEVSIDSPILPRYQRLYSKDEIVYSTIKSFKTGIITNDSNNTQDGWGSGGTTNFE